MKTKVVVIVCIILLASNAINSDEETGNEQSDEQKKGDPPAPQRKTSDQSAQEEAEMKDNDNNAVCEKKQPESEETPVKTPCEQKQSDKTQKSTPTPNTSEENISGGGEDKPSTQKNEGKGSPTKTEATIKPPQKPSSDQTKLGDTKPKAESVQVKTSEKEMKKPPIKEAMKKVSPKSKVDSLTVPDTKEQPEKFKGSKDLAAQIKLSPPVQAAKNQSKSGEKKPKVEIVEAKTTEKDKKTEVTDEAQKKLSPPVQSAKDQSKSGEKEPKVEIVEAKTTEKDKKIDVTDETQKKAPGKSTEKEKAISPEPEHKKREGRKEKKRKKAGEGSISSKRSVRAKYGCRPENLFLRSKPENFSKAFPDTPLLLDSWMPENEREIAYYENEYPIISRDTILPPKMKKDRNPYFVAYRFAGGVRAIEHKPHQMILLPYQYESGRFLTCLVFGSEKEDKFFVLENFKEKDRTVAINLKNDKSRNYVDLPFMDESGKLFLQRTHIVLTHREKDNEASHSHGYFEVCQKDPIPVNAFEVGVYKAPKFDPPSSAPVESAKKLQLSVAWNPSVCYKLAKQGIWVIRERCAHHDFKIQCLFVPGENPGPTNDASPQLLKKEDINVEAIKKRWSPYVRAENGDNNFRNIRYWSKCWEKYGKKFFSKPTDFFDTAITLYDKLNIAKLTKNLKQKNIQASESANYKKDEIEAAISSNFGNLSLQFHYVPMIFRAGVLYEIRFCFEKKGKNWIHENCPRVVTTEEKVSQVYLPKFYETSPYVHLSLFWKPSQFGRLAYFHYAGKPSNKQQKLPTRLQSSPEWRIHKFCPSLRYHYLIVTYKDEMQYLTSESEWNKQFDIYIKKHVDDNWPLLLGTMPYRYFEYNYCGLAMRSMRIRGVKGAVKYFKKAVRLFRKLKTLAWTKDKELPFDKPLNTEKVEKRLLALVGKRVLLVCFKLKSSKGIPVLVKVHICYDNSNSLVMKDCPQSLMFELINARRVSAYAIPGGEVLDCGKQLVIPSKPELVDGIIG